MKKRITFDTTQLIATAWDKLWARNLKMREEDKDKKGRWYTRTFSLCASDIEYQVREFIIALREGKTIDEAPFACGRPMAWPPLRLNFDLESRVRSWLHNNRKITGHNFGRGHISGMRYRPVGEPLGPSEKVTIAKHEEARRNPKPTLYHYSRSYGGRALCVVESAKARGKRIYGFSRSKAWTTSKRENVTCARCKKFLAAMSVETPVCEEV